MIDKDKLLSGIHKVMLDAELIGEDYKANQLMAMRHQGMIDALTSLAGKVESNEYEETPLLERNPLGGYYYLSEEDSATYDAVKDSKGWVALKIRQLILDKAKASRAAHCGSRY